MTFESFPFLLNKSVEASRYDFIARVRSGISSKTELLDELSEKLSFPAYFGRNWDALNDCLSDLDWLSKNRIALLHEATPHLLRKDLVIYLEVLLDAVDAHKESGKHTLAVAFPEETRALADALRGIKRAR